MSALEGQVGGTHYKNMTYQPIKLITELQLNFIQGNIVKYITRYKSKNGLQDLEKVVHYAQLGQELNPKNFVCLRTSAVVEYYVSANNLDEFQEKVIWSAIYQNWLSVTTNTIKLIKKYEQD